MVQSNGQNSNSNYVHYIQTKSVVNELIYTLNMKLTNYNFGDNEIKLRKSKIKKIKEKKEISETQMNNWKR